MVVVMENGGTTQAGEGVASGGVSPPAHQRTNWYEPVQHQEQDIDGYFKAAGSSAYFSGAQVASPAAAGMQGYAINHGKKLFQSTDFAAITSVRWMLHCCHYSFLYKLIHA